MAKRPSVKEILELARKGGPAKPAGESDAPATAPVDAEPTPAEPVAVAPPPVAAASVPTPSSLGRPLTLKEKLAAARSGGTAPAATPPAATATPAAAGAEAVKSVPPPAAPIGRPLTLAEKLAAARSGGAAPAPTAGAAAAPKPAAVKAAGTAPAAPKAAAVKRELPPLDKITDPKDLAEALRQAGDKKAREVADAKAKDAPAPKPSKSKETAPQTVLPRPTRDTVRAAAAYTRRAFFSVAGMIWVGWATFTIGMVVLTEMCVRFMFPNVLAEPPSTIKVGPASNFEPEVVNERFKAEWGFWIVRSARYTGTDIIYALQSVCTHLGCPPNWLSGEQKFKCPCHGSGFYISGINFEGPAPRPLERFKVTTADDGQLVVDKSQKFQEELGQWADPDSYIQA